MPTSTFCSTIESRRMTLPRRGLLELRSKPQQGRLVPRRRDDLRRERNTRRRVHAHRYDDRWVPRKVPRVLERRVARVRVEVAEPPTLSPSRGVDRRLCQRWSDDDVVRVEERLQMRAPPL